MQSWRNLAGSIWQDARYALRWFRREPVLTAAIVFTLAFGIGLNSGVFSVLSGMVFRSRAEVDTASFVQILANPPAQPDAPPRLFGASTRDLHAWRRAPGIESIAAWAVSSGRLQDDPDPSLLLLVDCGFFHVYGLDRPKLGRLFQTSECDSPQAAPVALLSEELWRDRFHADPAIVGRRISINRAAYLVAGILPAGFPGRLRGPGIWIPYARQATFYGGVDLFREDTRPWLTVEARVSPGVSHAALTRELTALAAHDGRRTVLLTNGSIIQDPSNRALAASVFVLLTGALGLILLLACTNVTVLLLSRAVARRYEMSVRLALGASRARLLRMSATEGILLSLLAGGPSVILAAAVPAALRASIPRMPHYPIQTDWVVFAYMAGITLLAGCTAALVPAAESLRSNLSGSLKRQESVFSRRWRVREMLVAGQMAMSLVLVVAAALFARTEHRLFASDPGFDTRRILMAPLSAGESRYAAIEARLRAIPGVSSVSFASAVFWSRGEAITAVSPDFFQTLGMPILRGRPLDPAAPHRVVVTEASAARLWPGQDPLRQTLDSGGARWDVGGVVRESELDRRSPAPRIFRVLDSVVPAATALLRVDGDPAPVVPQVTAALDSLGVELKELPRTLAADIGEMGSRFGVTAGFALFFGVSAFALAVAGVAGVMAFAVSRRTREMGIRLALGATRGDVVREVLRSGLRPVAWGLALGLPLAALFAAGLAFAFRNTPTPFDARDPVAFGVIPLLMIASAVAAMLRPALRACSTNPASSLRQE